MSFEDNIKKEKLILPIATAPVGSYVAIKQVDKLLFISGQISLDTNGKLIKGKVGSEINIDTGIKAAKAC